MKHVLEIVTVQKFFKNFIPHVLGLNFTFDAVFLKILEYHTQCRCWSDCSIRSSLIWVCTVCICHFVRNFSVQNFRTFTMFMYMSLNVRKHIFGHMHPARIQISLRICGVWSESSLGIFWKALYAKLLQMNNEDWSTVSICRQIWVFVVCKCRKVQFLRQNC